MNFISDFFFQTKLLCSIPEDQKPISQYIELKENETINWTSFSFLKYKYKLIFIYSFLLCLVTFFQFSTEFNISLSFFGNLKVFIKVFVESIKISSYLFLVYFFIILTRWKELSNRFRTSSLFYEESSWFDGQIWGKSFFILKNDRLLLFQKILPILKRITKSFIFIFLLVFFTILFILFFFN
jgi:hypothetical protein